MKSAVEQLSNYKSLHLNQTNLKTHFFGVTVIVWSVMTLFSLVTIADTNITLTIAAFPFLIAYYCAMHLRMGIAMLLGMGAILLAAHAAAQFPYAGFAAVLVFVIGWIFQFIGHHYEKAKPAFFTDIMQLLIGPFFLMAELLWALGFEKELEEKVTPLAVEKRRAFERSKDAAVA